MAKKPEKGIPLEAALFPPGYRDENHRRAHISRLGLAMGDRTNDPKVKQALLECLFEHAESDVQTKSKRAEDSSKGGNAAARQRKRDNDERDSAIQHAAKCLLAEGKAAHELASILARRFPKWSRRTIKRIIDRMK